ncbi:MAG: radical SAM protein [Candidatus Jordarchaeaceae archaeon]
MNLVHTKSDDISLIAQPYGAFVYSKKMNSYTVVNNTSYELLKVTKLTNGDLREAAKRFSQKFAVNEKLIFHDIVEFFKECPDFFEFSMINDQLFSLKLEYENKKNILKMVKASLDLTNTCNLKCKYCYANSNRYNALKDISLENWINILTECHKRGLRAVEVTGGEPLLYRDFLKLLEFISKLFIFEINTNGLLINEDTAKFISNLRPKTVQVSLDSSIPEIHEFFRGKGTWKKVLKSIEMLRSFSIPVRISMTVSNLNKDDIEAMKNLSDSFGCELIVQSMKPAGRAKDLNRELFVDDPEDKSSSFYEFEPSVEVYCQTQLGYASISNSGLLKACNMTEKFFFDIGVYSEGEEDKIWYLKWFEETRVGRAFKEINSISKQITKYREKIKKEEMIYKSCILEAYWRFIRIEKGDEED